MSAVREDGQHQLTGVAQVLAAIENVREEFNSRMDQQDAVLGSVKTTTQAQEMKLEAMEKVLPMKFFRALDGTVAMGSMVGKFGVWCAKIGGACILIWAFWKFAVQQAIQQLPK